jgi:hypothetical protein
MMFLRVVALIGDYVSEVIDFLGPQVAFLGRTAQTVYLKSLEHQTEMFQVFFMRLGIDYDDVVQVHHSELP